MRPELRRPRATGGLELDIPRTIKETADRAGIFSPIWVSALERPKYIMLIEEEGTHDHIARIFDVLVDRLKDEGVEIERFYFHNDPRFLTADDRRRSPIRLSRLGDECQGAWVILIGSGEGLVDGLTGEITEGVRHAFSAWMQRVLLSTRPVEAWSFLENELIQAGFILGSASSRGFEALADRILRRSGEREALLGGLVMRSKSTSSSGD